ncbi:MAG: FHA domain-containing protein, partial [bacterium]
MPKLIIKKDDLLLKKVSVPKEILAFTVGAEQGNDIIIEDESVSFFHLQFEKQNEQYFVRDLQSQWGTFVNGRKITKRAIVNNNDEIGVGTHNITFLLPEKENEPSFVAESYELEQLSSEHPIEDRISGLPKLMKLNSWIHEETETFKKKGDFFIENNNKPADVEDAIMFPTNDSSLDPSKNNNNSN